MDTYAAGTVLIAASALAAVAGLILMRRFGYFRSLIISHEASGQYLSIVGTLYAVLLGLIVVDAMERFQHATTLVGEESNALAELVYLAGRMPGPLKAEVHRRAGEYVRLVLDEEWHTMARGEHLPEARRACLELMRVVRDWEPSSESEKTVYAAAVPAASEFWNARRLRIIACQRGIPPLEWCAVILGGIVTVGLTYFLVLEDIRIQVALTAMVAVLIALNIFLILMFGYPFSGDLRVSPDSFHVALAILKLEAPPASH
jgi:Protein of unknown function (DUF4239)